MPRCLSTLKKICMIIPIVIVLSVPFIHYYTMKKILHGFPISPEETARIVQRDKPVYIAAAFEVSGLGNILFQYASLYGIARQTNRIPIVSDKFPLLPHFHLKVNTTGQIRPGAQWGKLVELHASKFDEIFVDVAASSDDDLELIGYFQSWQYFRGFDSDIRNQFNWSDTIRQYVSATLQKSKIFKVNDSSENVTLIGVHVRRGDMLSENAVLYGYTVANETYIDSAMKYFENKYSNIRYLITSDDIDWCSKNMKVKGRRVWYSKGNDPLTDLALLSSCDHVIMTVGTFGWWAGWLAGGEVIYYKDYPLPKSKLERSFSPTKMDYFLPEWISL